MAVDWSYFDKFDPLQDKYLPNRGEGDTIATQIVTAVAKLIYKWYNDGDVFDNTWYLDGWLNDLSSDRHTACRGVAPRSVAGCMVRSYMSRTGTDVQPLVVESANRVWRTYGLRLCHHDQSEHLQRV